ncbi:DNA polymerase III subunit chi [Neptunomonas marina]|uniref:DNA polymerase III subunit chi n=1 Tax=Neptunomonas marina TaxID=1815562 RepID=A0A437Q6E9_9GAMM|nr:DNA polymerase III subunit chi [Neptunomonas marina]RVU30092.1 DNA polymerase III subunit chi [Neptunomonas marina]
MPQADFYILPSTDTDSRYQFLTRLCGRALAAGHKLYIHTASQQMAEEVSNWLWRAESEAFLPNSLASDTLLAPIRLGWDLPHLPTQPDMLVNLASGYLDHTEQFARIAEVVVQEPTILADTRQRFKRYQAVGIQPSMHDMRKRT